MNIYEMLQKKDGRYVIDSREHEVFYNPKLPETKKYNLQVLIDDQLFYFKGNGYFSFDLSELFCDQIAKFGGLQTINPVPAYFLNENGDYIQGILSKDYISDREKTEIMSGYKILYIYQQLSLEKKFDMFNFFKKHSLTKEEVIELRPFNNIQSYRKALLMLKKAIQSFNVNFKIEIDKNIMTHLSKYLIFYFLTGNEDCYAQNVEFVLTKSDNKTINISLAPLTDNSISLLLKSFKIDYKNFHPNINEKQIYAISQKVLEETNMPFSVFEKPVCKFRRESVALEIAKIIEHNPVLQEFYTKLKSLNLTNYLEEYRSKNNFNFIKDLDIKVASLTFDNAINQLEKGIEHNRILSSINQKIKNREKE